MMGKSEQESVAKSFLSVVIHTPLSLIWASFFVGVKFHEDFYFIENREFMYDHKS